MKIIATFCALALVATTFKASAQNEQTRQVSGFTGISNNGSFDVKVKIDGKESVRVEAEKGEYDKIETVVEAGVLRIGTKGKWGWRDGVHGNVTVYVSAKSLSAVRNNGSGDITVEGDLHGGDVQAANSGSGSVKVTGNLSGDKIDIGETGSGDVKIEGGLTSTDVSVRVSGSGNIKTNNIKTSTITTRLSGSGNITLSGTATTAEIVVSSSGQINGRDLKAETVKVGISGSGNVHIGAQKTISAHVSGSGNIIYNGPANISEISTTGSGSIRRGND